MLVYGLVHLAGTFEPDDFIIGETENVFDQSIKTYSAIFTRSS